MNQGPCSFAMYKFSLFVLCTHQITLGGLSGRFTLLAYRPSRSGLSACTADVTCFFPRRLPLAGSSSPASPAALLPAAAAAASSPPTVNTNGPMGTSSSTASSGSSASTTSRMQGRDLGTLCRHWCATFAAACAARAEYCSSRLGSMMRCSRSARRR
ncbi:Os06g0203000 [Oryza sativa Japonica Group]|uniref:Os06g0203000 protein n=1 Tax=Oryza sativa subsp. japonica TaxID=39947 RepID=Q69SQ6_ORYSJ|nr:unknown protein [Oryza sativa Japonica Group]BAF18996.1 Os06g0203000 [Oryza sativa Japonica Group]|eukprot:NP_001057082.1 Os06g0203000 [Oryza sativa Japonica Group]